MTTSMKPREFTITRRGELTFTVHGAMHCGSRDFTKPVTVADRAGHILTARWTIEASATADSLDSRGFLFDQTELDKLVHRVATRDSYDSCERLTKALADAFCHAVAKENEACVLQTVRVTLSPQPYLSDITTTLHRS